MTPDGVGDLPTTDDAFLGGALTIRQPVSGYRAGLDAVLLAASVDATRLPAHGARLIDAGSGVGVVGLCLARRIAAADVTLVEVQPEKAQLAAANAARNGLSNRVIVLTADVTAPGSTFSAAGLRDNAFDAVAMNPPYYDAAAGTSARDAGRERAHAMPGGQLDAWLRFAARCLKPRGRLYIIHTAAALPDILAGLAGRFGDVVVKPVLPRDREEANRVLVTGTKGSRAPFRLAPPFVVHDPARAGGFTPEAEAILRNGAALAPWT